MAEKSASESLSRPECMRLLRARSGGRVALSLQALPAVLPVAYVVVGDDLVFGTWGGSVGSAGLHGNVVAFEVDDIDPVTAVGWSVVSVGVARQLDRGDTRRHAALGQPPHLWADRPAVVLFRQDTKRISGRRLGAGVLTPDPPWRALSRTPSQA